MLNVGSMVWGFCVYFVYMIPLEIQIKALRVLMETMSCDFSSCRLSRVLSVDDILGIFEFVYCIFF